MAYRTALFRRLQSYTMVTVKIAFCAVLLFSGTAVAAGLTVEPGKTFFENDQVKVLRALEKPHVKGKFHEHKSNRVMVYLQSGKQRFEYQDGRKPQVFDWKAGQAVWSPADGMHAPEVISDEPFNIVEVELKQAGTGKKIATPLDPLKVDPKHYKVEFENDQVRVLRVKVGAHESIPMHEHTLNRVSVFLTDNNDRITAADGKTDTVERKAGDAAWGTPVKHKEENLGDQPFELLIIDLKN